MKLCVLFKESGATLRQRTRIYSGIGWPSIYSILLRDEAQNQVGKKNVEQTQTSQMWREMDRARAGIIKTAKKRQRERQREGVAKMWVKAKRQRG